MNESLHALSGAYVVDALDAEERETFEKHLPTCLDCQAEVASLREAAALMADESAVTPPPSLRASVLSGIKTVRPLPPETSDAPSPATPATPATTNVVPMRRSRRFRLGALAAAAAVLAVLGFGAVTQPWEDNKPPAAGPSDPADAVLAASDAKHYQINFKDGSTATVVRSLSKGKAVLVTDDMAAPPKGKVFELWLQDEAGHMAPAGLMDKPGDNTVLLDGDAAKATGVGITVEPKGGSDQPTSEPIALFDMGKGEA
ncbi:MAG: anti-sigma factor [Marmoricola sp.]